MDRKYDVVVVGGGPSGQAAAESCAKAGLITLLIEEQAHIGVPVQCAGLLSCSAFEECRVSQDCVLQTVSGATVKAGNFSLSFDAGKTKAFVVDRSLLDREMAYHAAESGADIQLKTIGYRLNTQRHTLSTTGAYGKEDIKYQILIAADGPRASIGRMAGLCQAPVYLSGLQCDIAFETEQDKVTIYPNASCEFFGWVIPLGEGRARVGLCGITNVKEKFQTFISGFNAGSVNFVSGTIPLGTLPKTVADGIMVVGDAAALAKPTSGGGVYTGIRAARHAAEVSKLACETGLTDSTFLSRYEDRWKSDFGKELKTGYKAFRLRQHINPAIMEQIVKEMGNEAIEDLIVRKGDMDRPGQLLSSLLVHPRMIKAGAKIIATSIKNCLQ